MYFIVGGNSLIGSTLAKFWRRSRVSFHSSTRQKELVSNCRLLIDLSKPHTFDNINQYASAVICAAVTDMAACEKKHEETRAVNVSGTMELIKKLNNNKTHIVFLSTNQVFDGRKPKQKPDASRNPINEYGRQKAEVEVFIDNLSNACILRLAKVIHPGLTLFKKWEQSLSNGQPIFAFKDMTLSPVNIDDVIKKIDRLVKDKATGIFQLSGGTDKSYYKFAQEFAKRKGYPSNLVKKDSWVNKLQFTPPKYTSLLNV